MFFIYINIIHLAYIYIAFNLLNSILLLLLALNRTKDFAFLIPITLVILSIGAPKATSSNNNYENNSDK